MTVYVLIYLLVQMPNENSTNYTVRPEVFQSETGCLKEKNYLDAQSRQYQKYYFTYCQQQKVQK